jgi:catalase
MACNLHETTIGALTFIPIGRRIDMSTTRRLTLAIVAFVGLSAAVLPPAAADEDPALVVGNLRKVFGLHQARAAHAKGIILSGTFTPAPEASGLTKAAIFRGGAVPVTVRFSNSTGIPDIADTDGNAIPRGFAIKFGTDELDLVTHSFNGFPAATADDFAALFRAILASKTETVKPNSLDKFLAAHPAAAKFLTTQKPPSVSFATITYFGVNAFAFVNDKGDKTHVRYRLVPAAGEHYLDDAAAKTKGPNYLSDEIRARVGAGPIKFDWFAQIAGAGDKLDDPSVAWPDDRRLVKLGTISVERVVEDQSRNDKALVFMPSNVPEGIEVADPMIDFRTAAYAVSFGERQ